jgi:hypothetical protein
VVSSSVTGWARSVPVTYRAKFQISYVQLEPWISLFSDDMEERHCRFGIAPDGEITMTPVVHSLLSPQKLISHHLIGCGEFDVFLFSFLHEGRILSPIQIQIVQY